MCLERLLTADYLPRRLVHSGLGHKGNLKPALCANNLQHLRPSNLQLSWSLQSTGSLEGPDSHQPTRPLALFSWELSKPWIVNDGSGATGNCTVLHDCVTTRASSSQEPNLTLTH